MKKNKLNIRNFQSHVTDGFRYVFHNYVNTIDPMDSPKKILDEYKFHAMDEFADRIVQVYYTKCENEDGFKWNLEMDAVTCNELRNYLSKQKNFIITYVTKQERFPASHIYQLLLEYIPYELNDVEKSILLDGYIQMLTDLEGQKLSSERRNKLEKKLCLTRD